LLPGVLGRLYLLDDRSMAKRATEDLEALGIAIPPSNPLVSQLSGGQRQAVAIGWAVAWARKVIVLDEPTNHLGARQAFEVLQAIRRAKQGASGSSWFRTRSRTSSM
jgi:simple sugar transport system ATP-binding protein